MLSLCLCLLLSCISRQSLGYILSAEIQSHIDGNSSQILQVLPTWLSTPSNSMVRRCPGKASSVFNRELEKVGNLEPSSAFIELCISNMRRLERIISNCPEKDCRWSEIEMTSRAFLKSLNIFLGRINRC